MRAALFEVEVAEHVLNERPRQTQLDFLRAPRAAVIAVEAKFTERGFGSCSCERRADGICSSRIYERPYWQVAKCELGLRELEGTCPLSVAYQPVRNIAAAAAIAGAVASPCLRCSMTSATPTSAVQARGRDRGDVLDGLTQRASVRFEALSWQQLLGRIDVSDSLLAWAHEKHGLEPETAA